MLITAASLYSTPMVSFIDRLLVWDTRMYVFNLSWPIKLADSTKQGGGGICEVLPLRKGGSGRKSFNHAEGGQNTFCGGFYAVA